MESDDLENWSEQKCMKESGCTAKWAKTTRQIDPFVMEHEGTFYCYYKTDGMIGVMTSSDLETWVDYEKPVIDVENIPGNHTAENPCVIKVDDEYIMFFTMCKAGRGMCSTKSKDLINWSPMTLLAIEDEFYSWAANGPSAGMVTVDPKNMGNWLMFIHGENDQRQSAAMAVLRSSDLVNWHS